MNDERQKPAANAASAKSKRSRRLRLPLAPGLPAARAKADGGGGGKAEAAAGAHKKRPTLRLRLVRPTQQAQSSDKASARDPKTGRFNKGASGNPKGRPKKSRIDLPTDTVINLLLEPTLTYTENGKKKKTSGLGAVIKRTLKNAVDGDGRAAGHVFSLIKNASAEIGRAKEEEKENISNTDEEIIKHFVEEEKRVLYHSKKGK